MNLRISTRVLTTYYLPRDLHPGAWWIWALGIATAASRTTNPFLLGTALAVICFVVVSRRGEVLAAARVDAGLRRGLTFMTIHFPDEVDTNLLTIEAGLGRSTIKRQARFVVR